MSVLEAIATGAAAGAVAAVAYLAHELGRQAQQLVDHERRILTLEGNYTTIIRELTSLRELITVNGT